MCFIHTWNIIRQFKSTDAYTTTDEHVKYYAA